MGKRIEIDGKFYRMRKGKLVEIPPKWVGKTVDKQTIRNRRSKLTSKQKDTTPRNPYTKGQKRYFKSRGLEVPAKNYDWSNHRKRKYDYTEEETE